MHYRKYRLSLRTLPCHKKKENLKIQEEQQPECQDFSRSRICIYCSTKKNTC